MSTVDGGTSAGLEWLRSQGVLVQAIGRFDARKRHTNKIAGALSLAVEGVEGMAVLTDTDVAICEDLRALPVPLSTVAMKIVDAENPPFDTVKRVFEAAGLKLPSVRAPDFFPHRLTVSVNGNGGIYVVPGASLAELTTAWERNARWLLEHLGSLGLTRAVDQMSMALTLAGGRFEALNLGRRWNLPTHQPSWISDADTPAVLHYHRALEPDGLLRLTGTTAVDERIRSVNDAISEVYELAFGRKVEQVLAAAARRSRWQHRALVVGGSRGRERRSGVG